MQVAPADARGNALGPAIDGVARLLPEAESRRAAELLTKRYGLIKALLDFALRLAGRLRDRVYLEIGPASAS